MTLFVDVSDEVVRQQDDDNLGKELATPNKVHVVVNKNDYTAGSVPADNVIITFDEITIPAGKILYINLEATVTSQAFNNLTNYVNLAVNVNGQGWRDLGNTDYRVPLSIYRINTWQRYTTTMLLDLVTAQGLVAPNEAYRVQFGVVFKTSASSTTTRINTGCDINATGKGGRGERLDSVADQNYLRLIVEEMD